MPFVESFVISYAQLSGNGSSALNYTTFTSTAMSALLEVKLNTKYSVLVFAQFETLGGLQLAPLVSKGFTVDTSSEGTFVFMQ